MMIFGWFMILNRILRIVNIVKRDGAGAYWICVFFVDKMQNQYITYSMSACILLTIYIRIALAFGIRMPGSRNAVTSDLYLEFRIGSRIIKLTMELESDESIWICQIGSKTWIWKTTCFVFKLQKNILYKNNLTKDYVNKKIYTQIIH